MMMGGPACQSCGRPMMDDKDRAGGRADAPYCRHCADAGGRLKSFDEVLSYLVDNEYVARNGMDRGAAQVAARNALGRQPAWKGKV